MPYILLILAVLIVGWFCLSPRRGASVEWIKKGGLLGFAILLARFVRLPLATILTLLPFVLPVLLRAENEQKKTGVAMTKEEAALILGVPVGADAQTVRQAHRNLITKNHPDAGGSDYLAAKINQARDVLLKE